MKKKNIVFIFSDQLRADFVGCNGATWLDTPNIDSMAKEGINYKYCVSPSPICVPARCSLMTGHSALQNRVLDNSKWLRPDHNKMGIFSLPEKLVKNGYHTAAIGKMHFYPWDIREGFQHRIIAEDKRHIQIQDDYTIFLKKHGLNRLHGSKMDGYYENKGAVISKIPEEYQIDKFVKDETIDYLDTLDDNQPFFLMVGFPGPHCPYDPSKEAFDEMSKKSRIKKASKGTKDTNRFVERNHRENRMSWNGVDLSEFSESQKDKVRRHYSAMVQKIDKHIGEIIQKLKDKNIYEDTILIISSDHGDYLGDYGMAGKGHFYESAYRVPLIINNKEFDPQTIDSTVCLTDLHNTILHFAQAPYKDDNDSVTLKPFGAINQRPAVFGSTDMGFMIIDDNYLLTSYYNGVRELYDIKKDPESQTNLIDNPIYKEILNHMMDILNDRMFTAINNGNSDCIAKELYHESENTHNPFNSEGWIRPYPFWDKDVNPKN
jgi:arylsulfatase A-like enzyme